MFPRYTGAPTIGGGISSGTTKLDRLEAVKVAEAFGVGMACDPDDFLNASLPNDACFLSFLVVVVRIVRFLAAGWLVPSLVEGRFTGD